MAKPELTLHQVLHGPQPRRLIGEGRDAVVEVEPLKFYPVFYSRETRVDRVSDKTLSGVGMLR